VLHPLIRCVVKLLSQFFFQMDTHIFFTQETSFQVLCKWVPMYLLCSCTLLLKLSTNWYPCLIFSRSLQIGTHVFFFQDLCKLVPMSSFLKIFANWYPCLRFSRSLQIGTHVFFSQDLCKLVPLLGNAS
jgi:hypothetical protein